MRTHGTYLTSKLEVLFVCFFLNETVSLVRGIFNTHGIILIKFMKSDGMFVVQLLRSYVTSG